MNHSFSVFRSSNTWGVIPCGFDSVHRHQISTRYAYFCILMIVCKEVHQLVGLQLLFPRQRAFIGVLLQTFFCLVAVIFFLLLRYFS